MQSLGESDRLAQQLAEPVSYRLQAELCGRRTLGPAEMRDDDDLGAALRQVQQPRHDAFEPRHIGHPAVFDRNVEIGANENPLARDVDVGCGLELVEMHQPLATLFAVSATLDGVMPKCSYSLAAGAEAPKPSMPMNAPRSPSQRSQPNPTPASTPILGAEPSTVSR